ncbi:glycosyltransferase family 2 protein [Marinobacter sp. CA1]|uniref:glycosyltransferase family 2 protein n=1 Tax=Marinobacter sp. CA1 TaxID=2817656 RepID=UPI001D073357|nr:glycosyltransferase [Marinobacter sp. CA1]UDL03854.1 glycosyltransferase [Marinobacter sp. CA1]
MKDISSIEIIIPVYNNPEGVRQCLEAVGRQTFDECPLTVTVVDNGSSPELPDLSSEFPFASTVYCRTPGSYAARNAGASRSVADVLVFLDSDCVPEPDWLDKGVGVLTSTSERVNIGGEVLFHTVEMPTPTEAYQLMIGFGQELNIYSRGFSATANLFVWRSVFESVGAFEDTLLSGGDREWCWRAAKKGYPTHFAKKSVVLTSPRHSLKAAIIQTRRVVGGRSSLMEDINIVNNKKDSLLPPKGISEKLGLILKDQRFSLTMRLKVLCVAIVLFSIRLSEKVRLNLGFERERR